MSGIFISYRRVDSGDHAAKIYNQLEKRFGKDQVFMDVRGIELGTRFTEEIENALIKSYFFLIFIRLD